MSQLSYIGKYTPTYEDNKSRIKDDAVDYPVYSDSKLLSFKNRISARTWRISVPAYGLLPTLGLFESITITN